MDARDFKRVMIQHSHGDWSFPAEMKNCFGIGFKCVSGALCPLNELIKRSVRFYKYRLMAGE